MVDVGCTIISSGDRLIGRCYSRFSKIEAIAFDAIKMTTNTRTYTTWYTYSKLANWLVLNDQLSGISMARLYT